MFVCMYLHFILKDGQEILYIKGVFGIPDYEDFRILRTDYLLELSSNETRKCTEEKHEYDSPSCLENKNI